MLVCVCNTHVDRIVIVKQVVPLTLIGAAYCTWSTVVAIYIPGVRVVAGRDKLVIDAVGDSAYSALSDVLGRLCPLSCLVAYPFLSLPLFVPP
jgi:hypothetical protein